MAKKEKVQQKFDIVGGWEEGECGGKSKPGRSAEGQGEGKLQPAAARTRTSNKRRRSLTLMESGAKNDVCPVPEPVCPLSPPNVSPLSVLLSAPT